MLLGNRLFNDRRLSGDGSMSCASCHNLLGGGDDNRPTAVGFQGEALPFNTPTVFNVGLSVAQFWDGRVATLEEQAEIPIVNPAEMGGDWQQILRRLRADKTLVADFKRSYTSGLTKENVINAIATFERALVTVGSPFDRYLRGETTAISEDAKKGHSLFTDIGCVTCHQGQAVGGNLFQKFGILKAYYDDPDQSASEDRGRFNVTSRSADLHRFKVPSLRHAAKTSPYFHDGSIESLDDAIQIMAEHQLGITLTDAEVSCIHAFLESLEGEVPAFVRLDIPLL